jgi:hypothetical protein
VERDSAKKEFDSSIQGDTFSQPTFHAMCQWKIGEITVIVRCLEKLANSHCGDIHGFKVMHDSLGVALYEISVFVSQQHWLIST